MLEESAKQWKYKHQAIGRTIGRAEGEILGVRNVLFSLLEDRFGPLSPSLQLVLSSINDVTVLSDLARCVYQVPTLEAFLRRLSQPNQN